MDGRATGRDVLMGAHSFVHARLRQVSTAPVNDLLPGNIDRISFERGFGMSCSRCLGAVVDRCSGDVPLSLRRCLCMATLFKLGERSTDGWDRSAHRR